MKLRAGFDVDGILADFNAAYIALCIETSGRDLFPARPFDIVTWNYPESYGYTAEEVSRVWEVIKADTTFWFELEPYAGVVKFRKALANLLSNGHDVYFITSRPGENAKTQTEAWLWRHLAMLEWPTVLISSDKGACARALKLTHYIDDRNENLADVVAYSPTTHTYRMQQPWNQHIEGTRVVSNLEQFSKVLDDLVGQS